MDHMLDLILIGLSAELPPEYIGGVQTSYILESRMHMYWLVHCMSIIMIDLINNVVPNNGIIQRTSQLRRRVSLPLGNPSQSSNNATGG